jgi:hypothetical protein
MRLDAAHLGVKAMDLNQIVNGVEIKRAASIKPDADSSESKTIYVNMKFDAVPLSAVFIKAAEGAKITAVNGKLRKDWDNLVENKTYDIQFKAPASSQIDPEQSIAAKLAAMETQEERDEYIKNVLLKGIE